MAEARAETMKQERGEVYVALQYAASFHCLAEEWKDCEELKPKPKEKWIFVDKKSEETKHRTEWCAEADQVSMYEMWKRKQIYEDARIDVLDQNSCQKVWANGEGAIWEVMTWSEEWTAGEVFIWCRKCSVFARQRMGPKLVNCCKTGTDGHQRIWQNDEKNSNSRRKSPSQRDKELEN